MRPSVLLLALATVAHPASEGVWTGDLPSALTAAQEKDSLVLVDFYAPWCYSCYYMDRNVLSTPELRNLRGVLELVKLDVDSPEGARLKREWRVRFLPTYVLLNSEGKEVGRLLGEQVRGEFFDRLREILDRNSTLTQKEAAVGTLEPGRAPALAREVLRIHVQRGTFEEGLKWFAGLPGAVRTRVETQAEGRRELLRLKLQSAVSRGDAMECLAIGREILRLDLGCELPYDAGQLNRCVAGLPSEERSALERTELAGLEKLIEARILGPESERCADFRSPIELAVELYRKGGQDEKAERLLARAIDLLLGELGGELASDRSRADNLRVFLETAGRDQELERLFARLIAAFPQDYVYPYRYGRFLLQHGRAEEGLRSLDAAAEKAYGANRLRVLEWRARALDILGLREKAIAELSDALEGKSAAFPEEIASLSRLREERGKPASGKQ